MLPMLTGGTRTVFLLFVVLSLWASINNVIPLSVIFVVLTPLSLYAVVRNRSIPTVVIATSVVFVYFILSTLLYFPESFLEADFYRRDGNVFVSFMPILICGTLMIRLNVERLVRQFVIWASFANIVLMIVFFLTGGTIFFNEEGVYHFLFESHNAAGGCLSIICSLSLGIYFGGRKSLFWLAINLANLTGLFLTISRGSVLAMIASIFVVLVLKERYAKTIVGLTAASIMGVLVYTYPLWIQTGKPNGFEDVGAVEGLESRDANVIDRALYLWPRATDLFLRSPIVGTGFGSFDDMPYHLKGISGVFSYNVPEAANFTAAHAHNSYLHILAETGLVGLGLFVWMLVEIRTSIESFESHSIRLGLTLAFWVAVYAAFTEHRLVTPSQMLTFMLVFGLSLASHRFSRTRARSKTIDARAYGNVSVQ